MPILIETEMNEDQYITIANRYIARRNSGEKLSPKAYLAIADGHLAYLEKDAKRRKDARDEAEKRQAKTIKDRKDWNECSTIALEVQRGIEAYYRKVEMKRLAEEYRQDYRKKRMAILFREQGRINEGLRRESFDDGNCWAGPTRERQLHTFRRIRKKRIKDHGYGFAPEDRHYIVDPTPRMDGDEWAKGRAMEEMALADFKQLPSEWFYSH